MIKQVPNIDDLIKHASNVGFKKTDKTDVRILYADDFVLLKKIEFGPIEQIRHSTGILKQRSCDLAKQGVHITRTLDYRIRQDPEQPTFVYLLQDCAPGTDLEKVYGDPILWKKFINEPQSVFDKYVSDYFAIEEQMGDPDTYPTNLFYSPGKITFIDQNPGRWIEHRIEPNLLRKNIDSLILHISEVGVVRIKLQLAVMNYLQQINTAAQRI